MLGVHFVWDGDGPRLIARGTDGMFPCTSMEQGGVIGDLVKLGKPVSARSHTRDGECSLPGARDALVLESFKLAGMSRMAM